MHANEKGNFGGFEFGGRMHKLLAQERMKKATKLWHYVVFLWDREIISFSCSIARKNAKSA